MARRVRLDLMNAANLPQTGNGAQQDWPGGRGVFMVESISAGTAGLQMLGPGGTWCNVINYATTTDIAVAATKTASFEIPAGPIRATAGANTGCVCSVAGVPVNSAG